MPRGKGIWLNPKNGKWCEVMTHETALKSSRCLKELGLPDSFAQSIAHLDQSKHVDEIRLAGVKHGLIRMREQGLPNNPFLEVQFYCDPDHELWYLDAIQQICSDTNQSLPYRIPYRVRLNNLKTGQDVRARFADMNEVWESNSQPKRAERPQEQ